MEPPHRHAEETAEQAEHEAVAEAQRVKEEAEKAAFFEPVIEKKPEEPLDKAASIQERAKALFKDLPPAPADEEADAEAQTTEVINQEADTVMGTEPGDAEASEG
mgnify:CR=1 FL=1